MGLGTGDTGVATPACVWGSRPRMESSCAARDMVRASMRAPVSPRRAALATGAPHHGGGRLAWRTVRYTRQPFASPTSS
jgi:hypothetical protein